MPRNLQIRNVPDRVHRRLKARAALAGLTLSEFALAELVRAAELPTREEILARIAALEPVVTGKAPEEILREERAAR